jgi:arylsulfatase A-like enzyme
MLSRDGFRAPMNEARLRRLKAVYYGLMTRVDAEIGRLTAFLRTSGEIDRTLIIFTSDHGEEMGDHWLLGKGGYFDGSYHIPLLVRDPRADADPSRGRIVTEFTESVDVLPTLLAATGAAPLPCDGRDLTPFIRGADTPRTWRTEAHWEYDFRSVTDPGRETLLGLTAHQCALNVVRGERYKYVHFTGLAPLFFDLERDPGELDNRVDDPDYRDLALSHAQKLLSWRMNHDEHALTHIALTSDGPRTRVSPRY